MWRSDWLPVGMECGQQDNETEVSWLWSVNVEVR